MARRSLEVRSPSEKLANIVYTAILLNLWGPSNVLSIFQNTSYSIYEAVSIGEYHTYGSVRLVSYQVPHAAVIANWTFYAAQSPASCPAHILQIRLQHAGFPVVNPYNETFPDNFLLDGSSVHNISISASGKTFSYVIRNPPSGSWFAAIYGTAKTNVVKKLTSKDCMYTLASNLTVVDRESVEDLLVGRDPFTMKVTLTQQQSLFRFFLDKETWAYELIVKECQVNGSKLAVCPLEILTRSQALPTNQTDSHYIDCSSVTDKSCQLSVLAPSTNHFQYISFTNLHGPTWPLTFHMLVKLKDCSTVRSSSSFDCYPLHKMYRIS
jgi:hypothetical protein